MSKAYVTVSKVCFNCAYDEIIWHTHRTSQISVNLTAEENITCRRCNLHSIRLDFKIVDPIVIVESQSRLASNDN